MGIEVPIFSVGFGESAGPELAAAVSGAGGCGVLGAGTRIPTEEVLRRIRRVRELTDRPFGTNVIIAALGMRDVPEEVKSRVRARIALLVEQRVPLLVLFWGDPGPFVQQAHAAGVKVLVQVGSVEEARAAAAAGVDAIIAQGSEAGGHVKSKMPIWQQVPEVVAAVGSVPVLASGGIGDGAGIARALRLGAQGVSMGTRFVASEEAWIHRAYKERVARAKAEDTFYSENLFDVGWPDAPHRVLKNKTFTEWDAAGRPAPGGRPGEGKPIGTIVHAWGEREPFLRYQVGMLVPDFDGDPEYAPFWAGESCSVVKDIRPAAEIVRQLARDAERALAT